jgi:ABC-2 type transport system ATP-binding protein
MGYTVITDGICKTYAGQVVLDHVDLAVETGSVLALLGPNGAGKTTMVRILATLIRPDEGTATVAGHDLVGDPVGVKRSISLTGQYAAVDDVLTGQENLEMMGQLRRLSRRAARARARALLSEFELTDARDRRVKSYSGGMKRRLDLAVSMIERPELLFLDEPTAGLDPRSREQLWSSVGRLVREGVSVLLTTQYLEEADRLSDTVVLLDRGRVVARGTPAELKRSLGTEMVRLEFADPTNYSAALRRLKAIRTDNHQRTIDVATGGGADEVLRILGDLEGAGTPAAKVSTYRPSLDDVFMALTSEDHSPVPRSTEFAR